MESEGTLGEGFGYWIEIVDFGTTFEGMDITSPIHEQLPNIPLVDEDVPGKYTNSFHALL